MGGGTHAGHGHSGDVDTLSVPPSLLQAAMGTAALDLLWTVLLLPLLVFGVPTEEHPSGEAVASSPPGRCRRCCDSEDPLAPAYAADESSASPSSLPYVWPEVRPYINMTILKGEYLCVAQAGLARSGTWRAWGVSSWAWGGEEEEAGETRTENYSRPFCPHINETPTMCQDSSEFWGWSVNNQRYLPPVRFHSGRGGGQQYAYDPR